MRILTWLGDHTFGAKRHLEGVVVAVLFVPVLPDLFVDWFGDPARPDRDGWLRLTAIAAVVVLVVLVAVTRAQWARRRAHRARQPFTPLPLADILVVPLSAGRTNYVRTGRRDREPHVPEFLCAHIRPATVIGIVTPQLESTVDTLTEELAADGITFVAVRVDNAHNPITLITHCAPMVQQIRVLAAPTDCIVVDVTGGTVPLTLAMMRVAASLGARCVYVASGFGNDGKRIAYSHDGHSFDPRVVVETV